MIDKKTYTTFSASKELRVDRACLHEWILKGYVVPSVKAKGKGTKALFSEADMRQLMRFIALLENGFTRKNAAELSRDHDARERMICFLMNLDIETGAIGGSHAG